MTGPVGLWDGDDGHVVELPAGTDIWSLWAHGFWARAEFGISHPLGVALGVPERLLSLFWQPVIGAIPAPAAGSAVTRPGGQVPPQLSSCGWTQCPSVGPSSEAERPYP